MADDWKVLCAEADTMKEQAQLKPEHEMLMNAHAAGVQHPEVLWRLARSCYDVAQEIPTTEAEARKTLFV